jgi:hypothetical protein
MRAMKPVAALVAASILCFPAVVGTHTGLAPVGVAMADGTTRPKVGDVIAADQIEVIESPGRYGLGREPRNSRYAIVGGSLVRIDTHNGKILSILRQQAVPLD